MRSAHLKTQYGGCRVVPMHANRKYCLQSISKTNWWVLSLPPKKQVNNSVVMIVWGKTMKYNATGKTPKAKYVAAAMFHRRSVDKQHPHHPFRPFSPPWQAHHRAGVYGPPSLIGSIRDTPTKKSHKKHNLPRSFKTLTHSKKNAVGSLFTLSQ